MGTSEFGYGFSDDQIHQINLLTVDQFLWERNMVRIDEEAVRRLLLEGHDR